MGGATRSPCGSYKVHLVQVKGAGLRGHPTARQRAIIDSPDALWRDASLRAIIDFPQRAIIDSADTLRRHASLRSIIDSPQRDASLHTVIDTNQVTRCRNFPLDNSSV